MDKQPETVTISPKQKTNRLGKFILFTVGSALLILILYLYGVFSFIHVRIYGGDRITGQIYVTVDGKEYIPPTASAYYNNSAVSIKTEEDELPVNKVLSDSSGSAKLLTVKTFAVKGGEEGAYTIDFRLDKDELYDLTGAEYFKKLKDDIIVHFKYNNKKWYYITELKFNLTITADNAGITCGLDAYYFADNAERYKVSGTVKETVRIDNLANVNEIEFVIYK